MTRWLALVVTVGLVACGGKTPTTPSPPPVANVAGQWSGTFESSWGVVAVVMDLTQAASTVNGTYAVNGAQGNLTGTVTSSSFSGSISMTTPSAGGGICNGTGAISGGAGGTTMRWTSVGITTTNCSGMPTNIVFNVQRR